MMRQSTIQHSTDGKTWTKATSGGFVVHMYGGVASSAGLIYPPGKIH
jgi:hypothetical protein